MIGEDPLVGMDPLGSMIECGQVYGYAVCRSCGRGYVLRHSCNRWECPECWERVARRASERAYFQTRAIGGRIRHWIFSPPPDWGISEENDVADAYMRIRAVFRSYFPRVGGLIVFHPFRLLESATLLPRALRDTVHVWCENRMVDGCVSPDLVVDDIVCDQDEIQGNWRAVRVSENWREHIRYSPHFHCFISGFLPKSAEIALRNHGWVIKLVRDVSAKSDFICAGAYLFSHALYPGARRRIYRFITPKGYQLKCVKREFVYDNARCPWCGGCYAFVESSDIGRDPLLLRNCADLILRKQDLCYILVPR